MKYDYKELITDMLDKMENEEFLWITYSFVKELLRREKESAVNSTQQQPQEQAADVQTEGQAAEQAKQQIRDLLTDIVPESVPELEMIIGILKRELLISNPKRDCPHSEIDKQYAMLNIHRITDCDRLRTITHVTDALYREECMEAEDEYE